MTTVATKLKTNRTRNCIVRLRRIAILFICDDDGSTGADTLEGVFFGFFLSAPPPSPPPRLLLPPSPLLLACLPRPMLLSQLPNCLSGQSAPSFDGYDGGLDIILVSPVSIVLPCSIDDDDETLLTISLLLLLMLLFLSIHMELAVLHHSGLFMIVLCLFRSKFCVTDCTILLPYFDL